jgi:hypothetical protein
MASANSSRSLASFYDCLGNLISTHKIDKLGDFKEFEGDIYAYVGVMDGIGQYRLTEKEVKVQVQGVIQKLHNAVASLSEENRKELDRVSERFLEVGYLGSKEERFLSGLLEKVKVK